MKEKERGSEFQNNATKSISFRQTIEVYFDWLGCWILHLTFLGGPLLFLYMCITPSLRIFAVAYLFWMYYDRETPHKGGRRLMWLKKLRFWRHRRDYFPIKLVKTSILPPNTTYLFASFPHGFLAFGATTNVLTDVNHAENLFPGLKLHKCCLNTYSKIPFTRDLLLLLGTCSCTAKSLLHILKGPPGNVAVLTVGGLAEMMRSNPGTNRIILKNRKGFVKIALKSGSCLVPVYTFGEPDIYTQSESNEGQGWTRSIPGCSRLSLFRFKGPRTLSYLFGFLPYQRPLTTVVGKPIQLPKIEDPSNEQVDKYHEIFVREMIELFDKYKLEYDSQREKAVLSIE